MIKAILYDLDGVLVDACEWHYISLNLALKETTGDTINRTEHETVFNGLPTKRKLDILVNQGRLKLDQAAEVWALKQRYTLQAIKENSKIDTDKQILHMFCQSKGIKLACITNSIRDTATLMLKMTGQLQFMEFVITNEDSKNPKPHSEGYIRAMILLGCMPEHCLIVEDSEKGLRAAHGTGANVLAVNNSDEVVEKVRKAIQ